MMIYLTITTTYYYIRGIIVPKFHYHKRYSKVKTMQFKVKVEGKKSTKKVTEALIGLPKVTPSGTKRQNPKIVASITIKI